MLEEAGERQGSPSRKKGEKNKNKNRNEALPSSLGLRRQNWTRAPATPGGPTPPAGGERAAFATCLSVFGHPPGEERRDETEILLRAGGSTVNRGLRRQHQNGGGEKKPRETGAHLVFGWLWFQNLDSTSAGQGQGQSH